MAGAIGLSGIHNVTGICDLCGEKCDPNKEDLNALDCTYKDCPSMVYHQSCLERYLKSIRLEKNRKTGFKCPRGCGKRTQFLEPCRGKVDKSHPIHVRHEQITKPKFEKQNANKGAEDRPKKNVVLRTPNLVDLKSMKALPSKSEEHNSEWKVSLTRSKSMDKTSKHSLLTSHSLDTLPRSRSRRSIGHVSVNSSRNGRSSRRTPCEGAGDAQSKSSAESVRSHLETPPSTDLDGTPSHGSPTHSVVSSESLDPVSKEAVNHQRGQNQDLHETCKRCLIEWKSTMLIQQLHRMGFEMWRANSAVQIFGSNIEEALSWLLQNAELQQEEITTILHHQPSPMINIELEMGTILHICQKYSIESSILESAIIRFEGDLNSAIRSLLGDKADECCFPDFDLSLGIVQSDSPFVHEMSSDREEGHLETLSDELNLGCVLGSALEDYKSGNADFTDLVHRDLNFNDHFQLSNQVMTTTTYPPFQSYEVLQEQYPVLGVDIIYGLNPSGFYGSSIMTGMSPVHFQSFGSGWKQDQGVSKEYQHFLEDLIE